MKQLGDSINKSMNNSKYKRLLGLEKEKLKLTSPGCEHTDRLRGTKTFIRMNFSDTIYKGNLRSIKKC